MNNFKGMSRFEVSRINKALINYKSILDKSIEDIKSLIKQAEQDFKPSLLDKLFRNTTLNQKYLSSDDSNYMYYEWWLEERGFITLDYTKYPLKSTHNDRYTLWEEEAYQVSALVKGIHEVYLNPNQARFVVKFEDKIC